MMTEEEILDEGFLALDFDRYEHFSELLLLRPNFRDRWIDYALFEEKVQALEYCDHISKDELRIAYDTGNRELINAAALLIQNDEVLEALHEAILEGHTQYESFLRSLIPS